MNEQIIQIARDAGIGFPGDGLAGGLEELERFVAAIRSATKEEDAKICDDLMQIEEYSGPDYASAIRASK